MTDSTVRCDKCGCEKKVDFATCLSSGWPKCCGYAMRLLTTKADIEVAVGSIFRPIKEAIAAGRPSRG